MLSIRHSVRLAIEIPRFCMAGRSLLLLVVLASRAVLVLVGLAVSSAAPAVYPFL